MNAVDAKAPAVAATTTEARTNEGSFSNFIQGERIEIKGNSSCSERVSVQHSTFTNGERTSSVLLESLAPIPFDDQSPPSIPHDILPGIICEYPAAVAQAIQVPFELPFINTIGALATVAQRMFRVELHDGYSEPVNIYALGLLHAGERKSPANAACRFPLLQWEAEQREKITSELKRAYAAKVVHEEAERSLVVAARKCSSKEARESLIDKVTELKDELAELPFAPRLLVDDVTPEGLAALMAAHNQRIGMIEAEGGFFSTLAGRYSAGVPNLDIVLKAWGGEPVHIDRRHAEPIILQNPTLTMILTAQPDVLLETGQTPSFRGRGLLGRLLFLLPQSLVGTRNVRTCPIDERLKEQYQKMLMNIQELQWNKDINGRPVPYMLQLAPEARAAWEDFAYQVEIQLVEGASLSGMRDWAGKLPGQAIRLAGLCHISLYERPHEHLISLPTVNAVLHLATLLTEHAKAAFCLLGTDDAIECAKAILKWLKSEPRRSFSARECLEKVKGRWPKMALIEPGLIVLEERAYIKSETPEPIKRGPGRPTRKFLVNQQIYQ